MKTKMDLDPCWTEAEERCRRDNSLIEKEDAFYHAKSLKLYMRKQYWYLKNPVDLSPFKDR
jgi:hypothetical protein